MVRWELLHGGSVQPGRRCRCFASNANECQLGSGTHSSNTGCGGNVGSQVGGRLAAPAAVHLRRRWLRELWPLCGYTICPRGCLMYWAATQPRSGIAALASRWDPPAPLSPRRSPGPTVGRTPHMHATSTGPGLQGPARPG